MITLPSDLSNYICTFHNPHKTHYDKVVRELILKHLTTTCYWYEESCSSCENTNFYVPVRSGSCQCAYETQLLLIQLTSKSSYTPYFVTHHPSPCLWLAETGGPYADGSWGRLLCSHDEFMEFFSVKVETSEIGREEFDYEYASYLDQKSEFMENYHY